MEDNVTMAQEDQTQSYSNGGGGGAVGGHGRSSKRIKQKKVPQRGLGVAQLEKIRLEEQKQNRDAVTILPSPGSESSTKSSYLPLPINNFHHSNLPSSTATLLPSGPPAPPPPPEFRSPLLLPHIDGKDPTTVPLANNGGFEFGWPAVPVPGHGNLPKLWRSHEFDLEKEGFGVEPGLPLLQSLPLESNPIWPMPNWVQRTQQYHHQQLPSSLVNISSGTSSITVPHFSVEPPSNQNYSGSHVPLRQEQMVGMKRPYPFSLDFQHVSASNYKMPTFAETQTNEKTPCESGSGINFDTGNSTPREGTSCSPSNLEPNSKKVNKGIKPSDGHFLTLATPPPISCPPSQYNSSTSLAFHNQDCHESQQENVEDQFPTPPGYRLFNQQKQPLYSSFLPAPKESHALQTTAKIQNSHEVGESLDLDLKL